MNRACFAVLTCLLLASAAPARGDTNTAAQALFEEGRRLMAANQYAEACPKFAESQRLDPGAGTLLNLALCYEKNAQLASAWVTYNEAVADADRSGRPEWVKRGKDKAATLAPMLTTVTVSVAKASRLDGLEVTRDGQPISPAEWGVRIPIDGGEHVIEARAPGHDPWTNHLHAPARGGVLTVTVPVLAKKATSEPKPDPVTPPPSKVGSSGGTQRTVGIVLGAVGVAGLGLGGGFAFNALSKHGSAKDDCNAAETFCGRQGLTDYDAAGTSADIATVAFIAGGALLVGGVILYLTAPRGTTPSAASLRLPGWTF